MMKERKRERNRKRDRERERNRKRERDSDRENNSVQLLLTRSNSVVKQLRVRRHRLQTTVGVRIIFIDKALQIQLLKAIVFKLKISLIKMEHYH